MDNTHPIYDDSRPEDGDPETKYWSQTETYGGGATGLPGERQRNIHPLQELLCQHNLRVRILGICRKPQYVRCDYDDSALADFLVAKCLLREHGYQVIRSGEEPPKLQMIKTVSTQATLAPGGGSSAYSR